MRTWMDGHASPQSGDGGCQLRIISSIEVNETRQVAALLWVSALHYLARDRVLEGFWTVASARVLRQPTSCRSKYFYNQCPRVRNLIGTEHSLIEVSIGLRRKQAKSNSIDGFRSKEVFPIDLDFRIWKPIISGIWKSRVRGIPSERESDCGSRMNVRSDQRSSRQWEQ